MSQEKKRLTHFKTMPQAAGNKERWGIILNHFIVNKPPDVSSKPTEKRGLIASLRIRL